MTLFWLALSVFVVLTSHLPCSGANDLDPRQSNVYRKWICLVYGCECDALGSVGSSCDIDTGQCTCRPNVDGRACDQCKAGYFGLSSGVGCRRCDCDLLGSVKDGCDPESGQCRCKSGVGGDRCDICLPGHYLLTELGCLKCEPCDRPGHLCDPLTGQCVCPPNTDGASCQHCVPGHWNRRADLGCQKCECDRQGSQSLECDSSTGQCSCFDGFGGVRCDQCAVGYYSYPRCMPCSCQAAGTEGCDFEGTCPCDQQDGTCQCKSHVTGERCDRCSEGTFGLSEESPDGCTECFCFTRSGHCSQSEFSWVPLLFVGYYRRVLFQYITPARDESSPDHNMPLLCYAYLTWPGERTVVLTSGQTRLNTTNYVRVIPGVLGDVTLGLYRPLDTPIYWSLPPDLLGDKIRSYNGHIRFRLTETDASDPFPSEVLSQYPLVQLQGNTRLVLEYHASGTPTDGMHEVKFHESLWRLKDDPKKPVTREMMMVALQNVQHLLIRATQSANVQSVQLSSISWDLAEPTYGRPGVPAYGIEKCACPREYNGSSCQDPSIGFYRSFLPDYINSEIIIDLVGEAAPCQCNGRSDSCASESGVCLNCTGNTGGRHCEQCDSGYYGNPLVEECRRCLCPSALLSNADSCVPNYSGGFRCQCQSGYTGERCDRCAFGFYGDALDPDRGCTPCGCDPAGSQGQECDPGSGQCVCRAGIVGRNCTQCAARHVLTERGCKECRDGCVEHLFTTIDDMSTAVLSVNLTGAGGAPWRKLQAVSNSTDLMQQQLDDYQILQASLKAMYTTADLTTFADTILIMLQDLLQGLPGKTNEARDLRNELDALYQSVKATKFDLEATVARLMNYAIGETPATNIERALDEARAILSQLESRDFGAARQRALEDLDRSLKLLLRLKSPGVTTEGLTAVRARLDALQDRLQDLGGVIDVQVQQPLQQVNAILLRQSQEQREIGLSLEEAKRVSNIGDDRLNNCSSLLDAARSIYDTMRTRLFDVRGLEFELDRRNSSILQRTEQLNELTDDYRVRYIIPVQVHASSLQSAAERLVGLFQATRQEADLSLQAADAYQNIINALNSALSAANSASEAAQRTHDQAYPKSGDSLVSLGSQAKLESELLFEQADDLRHRVAALSTTISENSVQIQEVNNTILNANALNHDIRHSLKQLGNSDHAALSDQALSESGEALQISESVLKRVRLIESRLNSELRPGLLAVKAAGRAGLENASLIIESARRDVRRGDLRAESVEERVSTVRQISDDVALKLQRLRNKILKARQTASNIRVSLTTDTAGGSCQRTYSVPHLQPSTASSVRLNYAIARPQTRDALLVYIQSENKKDFMSVEMLNRTIRFSWDNGGGLQSVSHPLQLRTSHQQLMSERDWYIIEAQRIGNLGRLSVRATWSVLHGAPSSSADPQDSTVFAASPAGFSILDLTASDRLYVGALPSDYRASSVNTYRFGGCLYELAVNGHDVGLWNFQSNEGCGACRAGPSGDELASSSGYGFNGAGYTELPPLPPGLAIDPSMYSVAMNIRTFDENALLFLTANPDKSQFISVELNEGLVVSRVGFSKDDVLVVSSSQRYNNGNWTFIETTKYKNRVMLRVNSDEAKEGAFDGSSSHHSISSSYTLHLNASRLYFGGVAPDFERARWPQVSFVPLLGCVDDLQVAFTEQNAEVGNSTGVTRGCGRQLLTTTGFHGRGYLELNSHRLRKTSNFGLTFKTTASDGLLLLSTFASKVALNSPLLSEYYMVAIVGGRIQLRVNGGRGEVSVMSDSTYDDGSFHTIHVIKDRRSLEVRVADRVVGSAELVRGSTTVDAPELGGLYFGGLPPDVSSIAPVQLPAPFLGCISDVIINDQLVTFSSPVRHKHVAIGRCNGDLLEGRMLHEMAAPLSVPINCNQPSQFTVEVGAVKFGDDLFSHVAVPIKRHVMRDDFNVSLDFRTFYHNGLLLHTQSPSKRHPARLTLLLRKGGVQLTVLRGKRRLRLSVGKHLNDGDWKMVTVVKTRRKYSLLVSGSAPASRRGPRKTRTGGSLFMGGLPPDGVRDVTGRRLKKLKTETLKGCVRQLMVNGVRVDLPAEQNSLHRVGQCISRVEQGTYFTGDSHVVYDSEFRLGDIFELELEVRTSRLNGLLLSWSGGSGAPDSPALALELVDGEVVFSVYSGVGRPIRARHAFYTKFNSCDNRWHSIRANFVKYQVTLKVDEFPERYDFDIDGSTSSSNAAANIGPLFLGGFTAESALNPAQLQGDSLNGCLRNVRIDGLQRDWVDMTRRSGVLINSCPL